jgi:hypothetical protein
MPAPVPSAWGDEANGNGSIYISDVMLVGALKSQKAGDGHRRAPIRGPWTMTRSPVQLSRSTTPPGKHVACPGEASAVKEAADGHVTGPWTMNWSPVRTSKAMTSPGKHVVGPREASAIKEAADNHVNLPHGMAPLREQMAVLGTMIFCFAVTMDDVNPKDNWANAYGTFVATLCDESTALATALALEATAQACLTLDLEAKTFLVVHGLRWWASTPLS